MLKLFLILVILSFSSGMVRKDRYTLQQVLILSRHNIRTPLGPNFKLFTPNKWPNWAGDSGHLTPKGATLEGYMGEYFYQWLVSKDLLQKTRCPLNTEFFAYSNTRQRTIASAEAFVHKAFPGCPDVPVHHGTPGKTDMVFNAVIHNQTESFAKTAHQQMSEKLSEVRLNDTFTYLDYILDIGNSEMCKKHGMCSLTNPSRLLPVYAGSKPIVEGPLKEGNEIVDAFLMAYYDGKPLADVAWGMIRSEDEWKRVLDLNVGYHNVVFNTTFVARDIAKPMIRYINFAFKEAIKKVILLMGHDSNMLTILNALRFKPYSLPEQFEITPVGSKIVFQKWRDTFTNEYLFKAEYVYMTSKQIREGVHVSLADPPLSVVLELVDCHTNDLGFCPWGDFMKLLGDTVASFDLW